MSTFPAGHILTSADMDTITPVGVGAWTSFTPTLVQSVAVTKTTVQASYMKIGRLCVVNYYLSVTGAGTAANVVQLGLPLASNSVAFAGVGSGMIFDSSVSTFYSGTAIIDTATTVKFAPNAVGNYLGAGSFTAGLASGDIVSAFIAYQTTT
jgi:hypothetical protein